MKKYVQWSVVVVLLSVIIIGTVRLRPQKDIPLEAESDQLVLRLAESYPEEHPSAIAAQKFADLVLERTDRRINIKVYFNAELGSESEVLKQMQFGGIALARVNFLEVSNIVSYLQEYITPYAYESPEEFLNTLEEDQHNIALKMQLEKFIPLVCYHPDLRCFYNNKSIIEKPADFSGLKLKTSPSRKIMNIIETLGAAPVNILNGNTFKSLSAGYMDGGETTFCEFVLSDFASVVPYISLSDYLYCPDMIVASSVSLRDVSRSDQQLLNECAKDTFEFQKKLLQLMQENSIGTLEEKNMEIQESSFLQPIIKSAFEETGGNGDG